MPAVELLAEVASVSERRVSVAKFDNASACPPSDLESGSVSAGWDYFATEDIVHARVPSIEARWESACGWQYDHAVVVWAGPEPATAYRQCRACAKAPNVEAADAQSMAQPNDDLDVRLTMPRAALVAAARRHKLWTEAGTVSHRVLADDLTLAVCSERLRASSVRRTVGPTSPVKPCPQCERLVAKARASAKSSRSRKAGAARPNSVKRKPSKEKSGRKPSQSAKERALFGRRMVVPVRILPGGAPGLGKRK